MIQPFGFTGVVLVVIWAGLPWAGWTGGIPFLLMLWLLWRYSRPVAAIGLSFRNFVRCFVEWWPLWVATAVITAVIIGRKLLLPRVTEHAALYFIWCVFQQLGLQMMVYIPLRRSLPVLPAALIAAVLFAMVHIPNPVLVPAVFVWGTISCALYERRRSVWGLALMQALLSSSLMVLMPRTWSHGFRVGPFY